MWQSRKALDLLCDPRCYLQSAVTDRNVTGGEFKLRGRAIEGATKYPIAAGDTLYIPANTAHQFLVEPGKNFTAMVVKMSVVLIELRNSLLAKS